VLPSPPEEIALRSVDLYLKWQIHPT